MSAHTLSFSGLPMRSLRSLGPLTAWLLALWGTIVAGAHAAPSSDRVLTGNFYQIELIVFMRTNVTEANTAEQLTALESGRLPAQVASFASVDGDNGYPFALLPDTRRMVEQSARRLGYRSLLPQRNTLVSQVTTELASAADEPPASERTAVEPADRPAPDPQQVLAEAIATYEQQLRDTSFAFRSDGLQQLREVAARLNRSQGYRLLHTGSWHQHVPARSDALPLLIQTGQRSDDLFQLEGTVSIGLGRYLHVGADFWYYEPELGAYTETVAEAPLTDTASGLPIEASQGDATDPAPATSLSEPALSYRTVVPDGDYRMHLSERRRMRSAELHYLDHPKLGVLVRIDPVPLSEAVISAYDAAQNN